MFLSIIKNATVQLPSVQVVKIVKGIRRNPTRCGAGQSVLNVLT
jgi:hypothetical protein